MGCNTTKKVGKDPCVEYDNIMREFASKFEFTKDSCYAYNFVTDRLKYIEYKKYGGNANFLDYRLNEVFYYQHNLTNEFLDLSEVSIKCLKRYTKQDIIKIFGANYHYNTHYKYLLYGICRPEQGGYNFLKFYFGDDGALKNIIIYMYGLDP